MEKRYGGKPDEYHVHPIFGRIYTPEETEFLLAVMAYRHKTGTLFVTPVEALQIAKELGYRKEDGSTLA